MTAAALETLDENRLRSTVIEQFGYHCAFCGERKCRLKMDRINRTRPESVINSLLICESCAEYERPGLFDDGDRESRRRR
jgi:predicted restriction endonuclease